MEVFKFKINDVGTDGLLTKVTQVSIASGGNNTANWSSSILGAKLSTDGGSTFVTTGSVTISASSIVFPITSGNLNVSNGSNATVSLFIYLKNSGIADNQVFEFAIPTISHGFTADATGSTFLTTFASSTTSNIVTIDVAATKLRFVQQPTNTLINAIMSPAVSLEATDVNNNRDLDRTGSVDVSSSGTLNGSVTASLVAGFGTAGDIIHTATGSLLGLTASQSGLTDGSSNIFTILPAIAGGDIVFVGYGTDDPDKFGFLVVNDIPDGTQILFTDNAWTGSVLNTNEGTLTWTAPSGGVAAGVVVTITGTTTASTGTVTSAGSYALAAAGDQILAYQGSFTSPFFVAGASSSGWISSGTPTTNTSYLPSSLSLYSTAVGFPSEEDNGYYNGPATLASGAAGSLVSNPANWIRSSTIQTFPAWSFTLGTQTIIDINATAQNLSVGVLESLTVNSAKQLTVSGTLTNNAGNGGLVIKSDAGGTGSLIHGTANVPATVERYINNDNFWHFLSSPVAAMAVWPQFAPSPSGSPLNFGASGWNWDFYYWNPNASTTTDLYWVNLRKSNGDYNDGTVDDPGSNAGFGTTTPPVMTPGRGYLAAYASGWSGTAHTFAGDLNQGTVSKSLSVSANTFNLAGNPYPSSIDWMAASGWTRTNLAASGSGYDYWIYNDAVGNYGVFNSGTGSGTNSTSRHIAPGQAFFVQAATAGNLSMDDNVRAHSTQAWLKETTGEPSILRLNLSTGANTYSDELIVAFDPASTPGGSPKLMSILPEAPELWSPAGGKIYSIARFTQPTADLVVPVSVKAGTDADYTLTATNIAGFTLAGKVTLEDLKTGATHDMKANPAYAFTAVTGDAKERFRLHFGEISGIGDPAAKSQFSVWTSGHALHLQSSQPGGLNGTVSVCNLLGQEINRQTVSGTSATITLDMPSGYYFVTLLTQDQTITRKIFVR